MADLIHNVLPMPPRTIVFIQPKETVKKCIDLMAAQDIGALVVMGDAQQLIGIVSERDIIRSVLAKGLDPSTTKAVDIAFADVPVLSPHDEVEMAMQTMISTKRRHILIREKEKLIAIISIGDLLFHLLENKSRVIEHLENYINS